jgi:cystathionine gamma-synthase
VYLDSGMTRSRERLGPATLAVLAGRGERTAGAPLNAPPVFASAFRAGPGPVYSREGNPTWEQLEHALGALEGGTAVAFSSGMAAVTATLEGLAPGARVAVAGSTYVEVLRLLCDRQVRGSLRMSRFDPRDLAALPRALAGADLIWVDAISNPGLDVVDLAPLTEAAREGNATVIVDSTLATPVLLRPLEHGADLVVHSATKHIGGHSDLMLGVAVSRDPALAQRLREARTMLGAVPGTMDAWLALRGLRTLAIRMERGERTAASLAERLLRHPEVGSVRYPGLPADPAHAIATRLLDGFGTTLSFETSGGPVRADAVCAGVRVLTHATSLGGVETLIDRPRRWHPGPEVPGGLLRVSAGCEDPDDLWRDLERAIALSAA